MPDFALQTYRLSKHFDGVYAVDKVSVELYPGQITGVIGPNGSGKTTFINLITGRYFADEGTISVTRSTGGNTPEIVAVGHLKSHKAAGLGITRTFQAVHLFNQMSVEGNLFNVLTPRNPFMALLCPYSKSTKERVTQILKDLGLEEKRHAKAGDLSYGQRKLLEIGRAMLMTADIYCFDEPFAGLFPVMIDRVKAIFRQLRNEGKSILWVEHNIHLIKDLSDRVLFMDSGELIADGTAAEVFARPEVLEAYLGK